MKIDCTAVLIHIIRIKYIICGAPCQYALRTKNTAPSPLSNAVSISLVIFRKSGYFADKYPLKRLGFYIASMPSHWRTTSTGTDAAVAIISTGTFFLKSAIAISSLPSTLPSVLPCAACRNVSGTQFFCPNEYDHFAAADAGGVVSA